MGRVRDEGHGGVGGCLGGLGEMWNGELVLFPFWLINLDLCIVHIDAMRDYLKSGTAFG